VKHSTGLYPRVRVDGAGVGLVSQAGAAVRAPAKSLARGLSCGFVG
jgi:hypothetical protein